MNGGEGAWLREVQSRHAMGDYGSASSLPSSPPDRIFTEAERAAGQRRHKVREALYPLLIARFVEAMRSAGNPGLEPVMVYKSSWLRGTRLVEAFRAWRLHAYDSSGHRVQGEGRSWFVIGPDARGHRVRVETVDGADVLIRGLDNGQPIRHLAETGEEPASIAVDLQECLRRNGIRNDLGFERG